MSAPPAARPPGFLAANIGKFALAFFLGFLMFAAIVFFVRKRDPLLMSVQTPVGRQPAQKTPPVHTDTGGSAAPELPKTTPDSTATAATAPAVKAPPDASAPAQPMPGSAMPSSSAPPQLTATLEGSPSRPRRRRRALDTSTTTSGQPPVPAPLVANTEAKALPKVAPVPPAETAPKPTSITLPVDTNISVRLTDELSTKLNEEGQAFRGLLAAALEANGTVVAKAGSPVTGRIIGVQRAGLVGRHSLISLELTAIDAKEGRRITVKTNQWFRSGARSRLIRKGTDVVLPPGESLSFRLMQPVTLTP